uniref:Uncharacterized protein n=1 Tax=Physcomitrium patens TaxID=3218 RepID=A0A2K1JBP6_PHYPA|nr:hypothetical protein PHYPA_019209 [Physcomitrium patens]
MWELVGQNRFHSALLNFPINRIDTASFHLNKHLISARFGNWQLHMLHRRNITPAASQNETYLKVYNVQQEEGKLETGTTHSKQYRLRELPLNLPHRHHSRSIGQLSSSWEYPTQNETPWLIFTLLPLLPTTIDHQYPQIYLLRRKKSTCTTSLKVSTNAKWTIPNTKEQHFLRVSSYLKLFPNFSLIYVRTPSSRPSSSEPTELSRNVASPAEAYCSAIFE